MTFVFFRANVAEKKDNLLELAFTYYNLNIANMASSSIGSAHFGIFANPISSSTGDIADVERKQQDFYDARIINESITSRISPDETRLTEHEPRIHRSFVHRMLETIMAFGTLGITSFGGPGVHVIILKKRFVESKKWLDETTFIDLFTLGNALPGPGSTQLAFSIAIVRNGTICGILAFLFWSLPGALTMFGLGLGVKHFPERLPGIVLALFTGINASAVGLIALAAFQLSLSTITDIVSRFVLLASASIGICYHAPWMYPVLVFVGGLSTLLFDYRKQILQKFKKFRSPTQVRSDTQSDGVMLSDMSGNVDVQTNGEVRQRGVQSRQSSDHVEPQSALLSRDREPRAHGTSNMLPLRVPTLFVAISFGISLAALLLVCLILRSKLSNPIAPRLLDFMTNMVVAGSIIFGGGPVVIPLLRGYSVDTGWVSSRDFLLGFALLQAMPGPNFNFAVYLGVLACPKSPVLGAFLGWFGIFSPGIMLKLALLPIYNRWRKSLIAKSILRGLNAAAVGLVYTAVWQLFLVGYIHQSANGQSTSNSNTSTSSPLTSNPWWGVVAAWSFVLSQWCNVPAAFIILFGGAPAGLIWYGVVGRHMQV